MIEPCAMLIAPSGTAGCRVPVQVLDQFTGWTQVLSTR